MNSISSSFNLLYLIITRYINRPIMRCQGLYDPTTIMNGDELRRAQKEGWVKLVFFLLSFFYYLYRFIYFVFIYLYINLEV